jgi:hypothetical protein
MKKSVLVKSGFFDKEKTEKSSKSIKDEPFQ